MTITVNSAVVYLSIIQILVIINLDFVSSVFILPHPSTTHYNVKQNNSTLKSSSSVILNISESSDYSNLEPQCPSQIYCYGNLLHTVQMASIYSDSKTFVDMKMHASEAETLVKFNAFMSEHSQQPSKGQIKEWVENNFTPRGNEFVDWVPGDWKREPKFLNSIKDNALREWASDLNSFWIKLGRKMKDDVKLNENLYSLIHVPNPLIVPGGRFLEIYYWDSYWILRGLLHCEMYQTTKGILENFRSMLNRFGHIPNGGRVYYLGRSQPPLLTLMIKSYYDFTQDQEFVLNSLDDLEKEFQFFMDLHTVEVNGTKLFRYIDNTFGPRPESYREDYLSAQAFTSDEEKENFYSEMKAGAESGMDFTSRWFIARDGSNKGKLTDIKTRSIIPVELNAIMYRNAMLLSEWFGWQKNEIKVKYYKDTADAILNAMNQILWHDDIGTWLDFDILNNRRRNYFSSSNLSPLWLKAYKNGDENYISFKILDYIKNSGADEYPGGIPNTLEHTGEQWDFPNVWAPLQHMIIIGLSQLPNQEAREMAFNWTVKYIRNNFLTYRDTTAMFEKYSVTEVGSGGGGGEYEIQLGFGWSNGAVLDLLEKYGDKLVAIGK
uniref:Trehalase n=1 Tax=Culicoides sonorensis TaxID=179676 RepID=A0A336KXY5_CULSO